MSCRLSWSDLHVFLLLGGELLGAAELEIGLGDLAFEHDQSVVGGFGLGLFGGVGLFDRAADAAEEVEFPGGAEAPGEQVDRRGGAVEAVVQDCLRCRCRHPGRPG